MRDRLGVREGPASESGETEEIRAFPAGVIRLRPGQRSVPGCSVKSEQNLATGGERVWQGLSGGTAMHSVNKCPEILVSVQR